MSQEMDRETLINVARTSLRTKVHVELADLLTEVRYGGIMFDFIYTASNTVLLLLVF